MPVVGTSSGKKIIKIFHHGDKVPYFFLDENKDLYSAAPGRNGHMQNYYDNYARIGRTVQSGENTGWVPGLVDTVGGSRGKPVRSVHIGNDSFRVVLENYDTYDSTHGSLKIHGSLKNYIQSK